MACRRLCLSRRPILALVALSFLSWFSWRTFRSKQHRQLAAHLSLQAISGEEARKEKLATPLYLADSLLQKWTNGSIEHHFANMVTIVYSPAEGLGNVLFTYASLLGIAVQYGIIPVLLAEMSARLKTTFDIHANVHPSHASISWRKLSERICCVHSPERFEPIAKNKTDNYLLEVFLQSYKYFANIRDTLRNVELRFLPNVRQAAEKIRESVMQQHCPSSPKKTCLLIGIQNRRGDFLKPQFQSYGFAVADPAYFRRAMLHYAQKFAGKDGSASDFHLIFAVVSLDTKWSMKHLANITLQANSDNSKDGDDEDEEETDHVTVNKPDFESLPTYSMAILPKSKTAVDLCFLTLCEHLIITGGTYSYWAAYLGKGDVVRMANYPPKGSSLASATNVEDYYPPEWIAL